MMIDWPLACRRANAESINIPPEFCKNPPEIRQIP
jgi:hypothetical protein